MSRATFGGKVAVVTGGGSGIGRALCEALGREGASVVVSDIRAEAAAQVARGIEAAGGKAIDVALDVTDAAAFERVLDETVARNGRIDYLFNNAGIALFGEAQDTTLDDWKRVLEVNLHGVVHGTLAAYKRMVRQGHGHIVNIASAAGLTPSPGLASYAASKHAVVGLSTSLRAEGAGLGVKVSVVCPGFIDTPIKDRAVYKTYEKEALIARVRVRFYPPDLCARDVLRGVARNRPIIVVTRFARLLWWIQRVSPRWMIAIAAREVEAVRRTAPRLTSG